MARQDPNRFDKIAAPHWEEGEHVRLRRFLTHGMKRQLEAQIASFVTMGNLDLNDVEGSAENISIDVQAAMTAGQDAELLLWIVDWTLSDHQGGILPLNQAGLDALDEVDYDFIQREINARAKQKQISPEDHARFFGKPSPGTEVSIPEGAPQPG